MTSPSSCAPSRVLTPATNTKSASKRARLLGQFKAVCASWTLIALMAIPLHAQFSSKSNPKTAPFSEMKWETNKPQVRIEGDWYGLVSVHGVSVEEIIEHCKQKGWDPKTRMSEDLVPLMKSMGHEVAKTTKLELSDAEGQLVTMNDVPLTKANRRKMLMAKMKDDPRLAQLRAAIDNNPFNSTDGDYPNWSAFTQLRWDGHVPSTKIDGQWVVVRKVHGVAIDKIRKHCSENRIDFRKRFMEDLVPLLRLMGQDVEKSTSLEISDADGNVKTIAGVVMTQEKLRELKNRGITLQRKQVMDDLKYFQSRLESDFSYLAVNDVDYKAAIKEIGDNLPEDPDAIWLGGELQKVMGKFIDGHASVDRGFNGFENGFLPFLLCETDGRFVAVNTDRMSLFDEDYPFVKSIDGVALEKWIEATDPWIAEGSEQMRDDRGLRLIRWVQQIRVELGLEASDSLGMEFANADGKTKTAKVPVADRRPIYGQWPRDKESKVIDGQFGYLRIPQMNEDAVLEISGWMPKFKETNGLIVDVRGNGGGSRRALLELAGYLMTSDDKPRIVNVAAYRKSRNFEEDHLSDSRFVYREGSLQFDDRQKAAIQKFKASFRPEWELPKGQFSEWHYLVLSKSSEDSRYEYRKPVVVLLDEGCFSATDIFLGAFKGWKNVSLVGSSSSGGSAKSEGFSLPHSEIRIRCASMASFQPDGKLYDTNGVQPDVVVTRPPEYFTLDGDDSVLSEAVSILKLKNDKSK